MVWRGRYRPRVNFALGFGRGRRSVLLPWAAALGRCAPWEGVMSQRGLHRGPALPAGTLLFRENRPTVSKVHPLVPTQGGTLGHKNRVSAAELDSRWSLRQAPIGGGKERREVPRITRKHRVILLASGAFLAVLAMPLPAHAEFVCDSTFPGTADGATAGGSPGANIAIGLANASGNSSNNIASGTGANASGGASNNIASGTAANA